MAVTNKVGARYFRRFKDEEGTISILTIGLFMVVVALLILVTDIASISVSRQSLLHATESAAIRASHRINLRSYYRGETTVTVPIDCNAAYQDVVEELDLWMQSNSEMRRPELQQIWLTDFSCSGNRVRLSTSAHVFLPFRLPQSTSSVKIHSTVEAQSDRVR